MEISLTLSDYVYIMDEGRIIAEAEAEKIKGSREIMEAYLGIS